MEYADACSEGSYHPPKVTEENVVPLPVPEPMLPIVDQSCPPSDQENIPPHAVMPPPLNVLVPIMEEEPSRVNDCSGGVWSYVARLASRVMEGD